MISLRQKKLAINKLRDNSKLALANELLSNAIFMPDTSCWILRDDWSIYTTFKGIAAHRLSYELFVGELKQDVLHHCDRKGCINPNHLFQGNDADNRKDYHDKMKIDKQIKLARHDQGLDVFDKEVKPWWHHAKILNHDSSRERRTSKVKLTA